MKKFLTFCLCFWTLSVSKALAQCPGCIVDATCNIPGGGLCPDSIPPAVVNNYYDEDITFFLPQTADSPVGTANVTNVKILAITGLPLGLQWQCNNSANGCNYNPQQNQLGCVKLCGVPIGSPGVYNGTVTVEGTGSIGFISQTQIITFEISMVLLPDSSSNDGFTAVPNQGCEPLTVSFTNNNPSNGYTPIPELTTGFTYFWDFGNGNTSTDENPAPQNYFTPGNYPVYYKVQIDTNGFLLTQVQVTAVECSDFGSAPDLYLRIFDANNNLLLQTPSVNNTNPPVTFNMSLQVQNPPLRIEVWDADGGLAGADDNCFNGSENPHPFVPLLMPANDPSGFGQITQNFNSPSTNFAFNYTTFKQTFEREGFDTIRVFALPPFPEISVSPSISICGGDSIALSVYPGNFAYEWSTMAGTVLFNQTQNTMFTTVSGFYRVKVSDPTTGCASMSDSVEVFVNPNIPTSFKTNGIIYFQNILQTSFIFSSYQWLFNGMPLIGATSQTLIPQANGDYALIAENEFGCRDTSNTVKVGNVGISNQDIANLSVNIYPNPATDMLYVEFDNQFDILKEIRITDISGKVINAKVNIVSNVAAVNVADLKVGTYFITLKFENSIVTKKFLK